MQNRNTFLYPDEVLGEILVTVNRLAKSIIFRIKEGKIHITIPPTLKQQEFEKALDCYRDELAQKLKQNTEKSKPTDSLFTEGMLQTITFVVRLIALDELDEIRFQFKESVLQIKYPAKYPLSHSSLQKRINSIVDHFLRLEAKQFLISRTHELALLHGVKIKEVKINASKGRWGSCSAQGNINLSFYLMKKPLHLIDYVILHELAHRTEMNHSDRFWKIVDQYCGGKGKSQLLRKELRKNEKEGSVE